MGIVEEVIKIAIEYARGNADTDALDLWLTSHGDELRALGPADDAPAAEVSAFIRAQIEELQGGYVGEDEARSEVERYLAGHGLLKHGVASQA